MNEQLKVLSALNDAVLKFQSEVDQVKNALSILSLEKNAVAVVMDQIKLTAEKKVLFDDVDKIFKNAEQRKSGVQLILNDSEKYNSLAESLERFNSEIIKKEFELMEVRRVRTHKKNEQQLIKLSIMVQNNITSLH